MHARPHAPQSSTHRALLFGSGLTSLIYQTGWQRMFRLVFGASTAASAAVLGIFFVYVSAGIVGFAFLCSELVWYRMLSPLLGGSSFTFGLILAIALFGMGSGGYLYSRRPREHVASLRLFVVTIFLEALAIGIPLALGDGIALYAAYTRELGSSGFWALVFSWFVVASVVILPAALVSGYQFPVIFGLLGRGRRHVESSC